MRTDGSANKLRAWSHLRRWRVVFGWLVAVLGLASTWIDLTVERAPTLQLPPPGRYPPDVNSGPAVGQPAPNFTLTNAQTGRPVSLLDGAHGPTVLFFGSFSWQYFCHSIGSIEKLYAEYQDRVHFYAVYISEAHADDSVAKSVIRPWNLRIRAPQTLAERQRLAQSGARELGLKIPVLVDALDNPTEKAYAAWPNRVYVVDAAGRIAYRGRPDPRSATLSEIPAVLDQLLSPAAKPGNEETPPHSLPASSIVRRGAVTAPRLAVSTVKTADKNGVVSQWYSLLTYL